MKGLSATPRRLADVPLEEALAALLLAVMTLIALVGTASRYLLGRGIVSLEQFTPELFVWMTFLGVAAAARRGAHMGSEVLLARTPHRVRQVVRGVILVLSLGFLTLLAY